MAGCGVCGTGGKLVKSGERGAGVEIPRILIVREWVCIGRGACALIQW